jgi:general secretion pathway protein D
MQERQEFLDHYFVFSDDTQYEPPKDYSRTNGLLEDIRQSYADVLDQRRLDELTRPREMKTHEPGQPLELPSLGGDSLAPKTGEPAAAAPPGAAGPAFVPPGVSPPPPPTLNVAPPARNVEKIER